MRIDFQRSGGFAGMVFSGTIDTDSLSSDDAREVQDMVKDSDFFNLPSRIEDTSGGADRFQYSVSIESDGRRHAIECGEASAPEALRPLLRRLDVLVRQSH